MIQNIQQCFVSPHEKGHYLLGEDMKALFFGIMLLGSHVTYSKKLKYVCSNKSIDESSSYYLGTYIVNINTALKVATFTDIDGLLAAEGTVSLKPFATNNARLKGSFKGTLWSESRCALERLYYKRDVCRF